MKIALAQLNPTIGDLNNNAAKIARAIEQSKKEGVDLVVFPEMAVTGYPPRDLLLYSAFIRDVKKITLQAIRPNTRGITAILGVPWRESGREEKLFNSALVMKDGEILSVHHKTLLPNYDVFDEHRYFTPAARRNLLSLNGRHIAVTICEDTWNDKDYWERRLYPEDPVEELVSRGADILVNISASPYHLGKIRDRHNMLSALARKYRCPLFYANQVGGNDELIFDGSSLVCLAQGDTIQAPSFQEGLLINQLNDSKARFLPLDKTCKTPWKMEDEGNLGIKMAHNRMLSATTYPVEEGADYVYQALVLGLRDYLGKTGFEQVVVGLSGGIDSSVTAALAVSALGPERVLGVLMPSRYSSSHSISDSLELAENLGMKTRTISIEKPFEAYLNLLNQGEAPYLDLAEENVQARIRGNVLMFISNRDRRMLLTTGNKSEAAVGYCTLYGDMSGGLAVLADVPKTVVYQLAEYINQQAERALIPPGVIEKAPSAELRPGQKDQDSLPPYEILDRILHLYIEENYHMEEITALGFDVDLVKSVVKKVDRSEYKRFQSAPGLRVTTRAFGSGRRMPIARNNST